jgi:hypothetical protein
MKLFSYMCLSMLVPTYFSHSCDHLQGVPQYKCQKYLRNHIKRITELSYILYIMKILKNSILENLITYFPYKIPPFSPEAFFLDTWPLKMGPTGGPETSVFKQSTLHNIPEDDNSRKPQRNPTFSPDTPFRVSYLVTRIPPLLQLLWLRHSCTDPASLLVEVTQETITKVQNCLYKAAVREI